MDTQFFLDAIARSRFGSQRELARHMKSHRGSPMGPPALTRLLYGERLMTVDEAAQLADLLELDLAEVVRRALARPRRKKILGPRVGWPKGKPRG
jgi:hypothetical protein